MIKQSIYIVCKGVPKGFVKGFLNVKIISLAKIKYAKCQPLPFKKACNYTILAPLHDIVVYFLVISFAQYKEHMICLISLNIFSDVLPAFTCIRVIGNLWRIFLGVNIFNPFLCFPCFILLEIFHFQKH